MTLPASWVVLLETFRPAFRRRGTFTVFTVLATGLVAQTGRRSVVGMLSGARMAGRCRFMPRVGSSPRRCGMSTGWD